MANDSAQSDVAAALARIPSGCSILTVDGPAGRTGMLVSWVQQAGFDPPAISVAVRKNRPVEGLIDAAGAFAVNLLGENPSSMFRHFGKGFGAGEDAFAGLTTRTVPGGVLLDDAIATLQCRVAGKHDAGDHWIYFGHVRAAAADSDARPYVHLRKNGLGY